MLKNNLLLLGIILSSAHIALGQGCSDAGFCTINSFKPAQSDSIVATNNQLKIGASLGQADHAISVWGGYIEYNRQINKRFGIDAKIAALSQDGNDVSAFGLSDLYLTADVHLNQSFKLTFGAKIPLTDGNKIIDNRPLPMDYQSSLGTLDFILGAGYTVKRLQLILALQQPLTQNKNEFIANDYPVASPLRDFQSTNKFQRSGDILFRISYPVKLNRKLILTPSLLPIYHLSNDKFTDNAGTEKEIAGSQGLTLNGNLYIDFELNSHSTLQLNAGLPFVVRDSRPDGLTRSFVANLEYSLKF